MQAISANFAENLEDVIKKNLPSLKVDVTDDFVGVFDGVFDKDYCDKWIKHFEVVNANGLAYNRMQGFNKESHVVSDQAIDYTNSNFYQNHEMKFECAEFNNKFWEICYKLYVQKFSIINDFSSHRIYNIKIQKTKPKQGYHIWHCEDSDRLRRDRILVFTLYLNDIEDGGETEFLYLSKRVKPVTGRVMIWPAGFTHTHRGNPPLKDDKYIITGWIEF